MDERLTDRDWLSRRYHTDLKNTVEIAAELGCSKSTVCRQMHRLGIPLRDKRTHCRLGKSGNLFDDAVAAKMYRAGYSTNDIASALSASNTTVINAIRGQGVKLRSKTEAGRLRRNVGERRMPHPRKLKGERVCVVCGADRNLERHHVNADPADNQAENLVWICWEHHILVEWLVDKALTGLRRRGMTFAF